MLQLEGVWGGLDSPTNPPRYRIRSVLMRGVSPQTILLRDPLVRSEILLSSEGLFHHVVFSPSYVQNNR